MPRTDLLSYQFLSPEQRCYYHKIPLCLNDAIPYPQTLNASNMLNISRCTMVNLKPRISLTGFTYTRFRHTAPKPVSDAS